MHRPYLTTAFGCATAGLLLGIYMAASINHGQLAAESRLDAVRALASLTVLAGLLLLMALLLRAPRQAPA